MTTHPWPPRATVSGRERSDGRRSGARERETDERGFTLIELLVTLAILPMVVGAIGLGLMSIFSLQSSVSSRVSDSGDAQIVSANFVKDVQSATSITTQSASSPQCGTTGTQLMGLSWSGGQTVVSYVSEPVTSGATTTYSLLREYCTSGNTTTPQNTFMIALDLPAGQAAPTITCATSAPGCAPSTAWISATKVALVSFTIDAPKSNFTYTLQATPRVWTASSGDIPASGRPYAPLTLLSTTTCPSLTIGNGALSINVAGGTGNGTLSIASACAGAVNVANNGTLNAAAILSSDPALTTISAGNKSTYPNTQYYYNGFTNPLASLVAPTPTGPAAACTLSNSVYSCPPGNYAANQTFPNGAVVNFTGGGTYWFENGLAIPNDANATFASATYIFDGTTALTTGDTSSTKLTANNVLFYIESGTASFGNNGSVAISPLSGYQGVDLWDSVVGGTLSLGNNSTSVNTYGGIYVPYGAVLDSNNGSISTTFIVASTATFNNGLNVNITAP